MIRLFIDADACPVKDEVLRVAARYKLKVFMVSNQWMRMDVGPDVEKVVVSEGADEADNWIVDNMQPGDIAITGDIPLASRVLEKEGVALGANGRPFTKANIGNALAMRELKAHLRETGADRGFNASFTKRDRSNFLVALDRLVVAAMRQA